MKITRFEDLVAWQKARKLAVEVYETSQRGQFARDFAFKNQIRSAALSISSNIAEGFERFRPSEFAYFLSVAKASCGEVRSQLYLANDVGHIDAETRRRLIGEAASCGRLIGRLRAAVVRRMREEPRSTKTDEPSTQHAAPSTQRPL